MRKVLAYGQGFKPVGACTSVAHGLPPLSEVTKVDDIFYRPAELGRAGTAVGIFVAHERRYSVGPNCLKEPMLVAGFVLALRKSSIDFFSSL